MATASVNILFGASTAYPLLLAFWGLNGLLQAWRCLGACLSVLHIAHIAVRHCSGCCQCNNNLSGSCAGQLERIAQ